MRHALYLRKIFDAHTFYFKRKISLRIVTGKKHSDVKQQRFLKRRNMNIWVVGHQINSLYEVLKLKQSFRKNKVVTGKTPFCAVGPFCTPHPICLNIGF